MSTSTGEVRGARGQHWWPLLNSSQLHGAVISQLTPTERLCLLVRALTACERVESVERLLTALQTREMIQSELSAVLKDSQLDAEEAMSALTRSLDGIRAQDTITDGGDSKGGQCFGGTLEETITGVLLAFFAERY